MVIPALINGLVFLILSGLHFYWALGGKLAFGEALPKDITGRRVLNPTKFHSTVVALGLLLFSVCYLLKLDVLHFPISTQVLSILGWTIAIIFLLRAIGDFRYVGFFKKIRNTDFAQQDTRYYSPLCVLLSANAVLVELL